MNEIEKKKALTTADLAAAARPPAEKDTRPIRQRREYEEPASPPKDVPRARSAAPQPAAREREEEERHPLFPEPETARFREEWKAIQIGFVDEPRRSVEKADALVASVIQRLAASFSEEKSRLEGLWDRGEDVSTEDLRLNLRRYRSFFDRLLNV
jgi:hypothetical protein